MITNSEKEIRDTKQRKLVLETVLGRYDHPTADMIYESVRKKDKKISKGTVYRNLNMLSSMGKITHVEVPGGDRFDSTLGPHYHVHCTNCGAVEDVKIDYNYKKDKEIEKETGYNITGHSLVFEGLCPMCDKLLNNRRK